MSCDQPRISVLMSVYNGEKYLRSAIDSILNQTFSDFEFIIVNDGSTDRSAKIIESYKDPRIHVINNVVNKKLIWSLNRGIEIARGRYIARMDSDDISLPERLSIQFEYLEKHPSVGILGCQTITIDAFNNIISKSAKPLTHNCNRWVLLFKPSFIHPTVVIKSSLLKNYDGYSDNALHAEDYELWSRLIDKTEVCQIPYVVLLLRKHESNVGTIYNEIQLQNTINISKNNISRCFPIYAKKFNITELMEYVHKQNIGNRYYIVYALSILYHSYIQKYRPSLDDFKWITNHFLSIMAPVFKTNNITKLLIALIILVSSTGLKINRIILILCYFLRRKIVHKYVLDNIYGR